MWHKTEAYRQSIRRILRATKERLFNFIIVQYLHRETIDDVARTLETTYPARAIRTLDVTSLDFYALIRELTAKDNDIVLLPDFGHVINDKDLYIGFNQNRDRIADRPLTLIAFVETGVAQMRLLQDHIPDFWSFRTLVVDLPVELAPKRKTRGAFTEPPSAVSTVAFDAEEERKELQRLESRIADLPDEQFILKINLLIQAGNICEILGMYKKGMVLMEKAQRLIDANELGKYNPQMLAAIYNLEATLYQHAGQYSKAVALLKKTLAIAKAANEESWIIILSNTLANVYRDSGQAGKARDLLEKALALAIKNFGENHPLIAVSQSNLANVYSDLGQTGKARDLSEKALTTTIKNFGENYPSVAVSQSNLALIYSDLGDYEKAKELLEKSLASTIKNFGENHPSVARCQSNLGLAYRNLGKFENARDLLEKALASAIKNFGENHPNVVTVYNNLVGVYFELKEYKKWEHATRKGYAIAQKVWGNEHPNTAISKKRYDFMVSWLNEQQKSNS